MLLGGQSDVHLRGCLSLEFGQHMRVGVHGDADVGVPQGLLDKTGMDTLGQ